MREAARQDLMLREVVGQAPVRQITLGNYDAAAREAV